MNRTSPFFVLLLAGLLPGAARLTAQRAGPDDFLPNKPTKGADTKPSPESKAGKLVLIKPVDKSSERVKADERNPFVKPADDSRNQFGQGANEENLIHERLSKLRVSGVCPGPTGLRVMLGDMVLSEGQIMPPVLPDQTLALRVTKITREIIQMTWLEKKYTGLPARSLTLPIDLRPSVHYVLFGQLPEAKPTGARESKSTKRANGVRLPPQPDSAGAAAAANLKNRATLAPPPEPAAAVAASPAPKAPPQQENPSAPPAASPAPPAETARTAGTPASSGKTGAVVITAPEKKVQQPEAAPSPENASPAKKVKTGAVVITTPEKKAVQSETALPIPPPPSEKAKTGDATPAKKGKTGAAVLTDAPASPKSLPLEAVTGSKDQAPAPESPEAPAAEPSQWKRALGLLENLSKLEEATK